MYQAMLMQDWLAAGGPLGTKKMPNLKTELKDALGMDLREELLGALDSTVVLSSAYSEGPWLLGNTFAVKVKDADKLQAALDKLVEKLKKVVNQPDVVQVSQTTYCGATIRSVCLGTVCPSYTIHNGWLVMGPYPQNVKAYLWRTKHPGHAWKVPAIVDHAIAEGLKNGTPNTKLAAVTVTDPRRSLELLLPLAPLVGQYMNLVEDSFKKPFFDVASIPHTKAITSHLSPNVTVFFDDGDAWRWETHATLDIPSITELTILYGLFALCSEGDFSIPFLESHHEDPRMTLPSAQYLQHPPQYLPASPPYPPLMEAESLNKAAQGTSLPPAAIQPASFSASGGGPPSPVLGSVSGMGSSPVPQDYTGSVAPGCPILPQDPRPSPVLPTLLPPGR
jgi:hypothetical protein